MATVFLADDHPVILKGLRTLLEVEHEFRVVGTATDGFEAVRLIERYLPNLLILDLGMPGLTGFEILKRVKLLSPDTRVLIYSVHRDPSYVVEALKNGASGYILKDSLTSQLIDAVRKVARGERYLNASISQSDVDDYLKRTQATQLDL